MFEFACPVYITVFRLAHLPSKELYQPYKSFVITELKMNRNRPESVVHQCRSRRILLHALVTVDRVWIGNWIYWTLVPHT
jgi:hypothetical protein